MVIATARAAGRWTSNKYRLTDNRPNILNNSYVD